MNAQLQQVAYTYLTRRSLWVVAAFAVLSIGIALAVSLLDPNEPIGALPIVGVAAAVTGYALGIHAKSQFANPRARLLPGFNRPHFAILAAILIAWCGVCPLVVALAARWSLLGALAASIAGTAAGIWAMHRPHLFTIAPAFLVFLSFGTEPTIDFWVLPASTPPVASAHLAIFVIAWGSIAYWLHRLRVLGEEDADYLLLTLMQNGSRARLAGKQASCASGRTVVPGSWQSRLADFFIWLVPASFAPATTIAARQRLLCEGPLAKPLWFHVAGMAALGLALLVITALLGMGFSAGAGLDQRHNTPMVGVMIFMTAAMGNGQLAMRRARMKSELMLPLRRQDYFHGLFASSAQYAFMIWITTQAAIVAYVALFMPDYFFPAFLAVITAMSLGFHMCMFGVQTSLARKNSIMFHFVAFMIILFPAASPVFLGLKHLPRPVATAAQREPLIQEQYAESYELVEKHLPPGKQMPPEMKQKVLEIAEEIVSLRLDGPPVNPYIPWACAAVLAAAGVAAFLDARKRWLNLELA
jgi:hypothetical protein